MENKDLITSYMTATSLPKQAATRDLRAFSWNLDKALKSFKERRESFGLTNTSGEETKESPEIDTPMSTADAQKLFRHYSENGIIMNLSQISKFCTDIGIDILDPVVLVFAFDCKAQSMGIFQKAEFLTGIESLKCTGVRDIEKKLPALRTRLQNVETLRPIYKWVFNYAKDADKGYIEVQEAVTLWRLMLPESIFPLRETWLDFFEGANEIKEVQESNSKILGTTQDLWNMLFEFAVRIPPDLSTYCFEDAWPSLIDIFVERISSKSNP